MKKILAVLTILGSTAVMSPPPALADGIEIRIGSSVHRAARVHRYDHRPRAATRHHVRPRFDERAYRACMHRTFAHHRGAYGLSPRRVHLHCLDVAYRFGAQFRRHR